MKSSLPPLSGEFSFLSGFPDAVRNRRLIMPIQIFADESGSSGQGIHMVMAGLISDCESWLEFSNEWRSCLDEYPKIPIFKMSHAANLSGHFRNWKEEDRDSKLRKLAQIINRHVRCIMWSVIDVQAHSEILSKLPKPNNHPYFYLFHTLILGTCFELWQAGLREKFEIIFDEQLSTGKKAKKYFTVIREIMRIKHQNEFEILPADTIFRKDDDFMPLQAADLFAWCIRYNTDNPNSEAFGWLLSEMKNVKASEFSCYYDKDRMRNLLNMTYEILEEDDIPKDIHDMYKSI